MYNHTSRQQVRVEPGCTESTCLSNSENRIATPMSYFREKDRGCECY
jgi:hypothetical protein